MLAVWNYEAIRYAFSILIYFDLPPHLACTTTCTSWTTVCTSWTYMYLMDHHVYLMDYHVPAVLTSP